jgi:fructose-bisphosphate aldolase, class I
MTAWSLKTQQTRKIRTQSGFIAALGQSGGSTPKAPAACGVPATGFKNDEEMFALVPQMPRSTETQGVRQCNSE